MQIAINAETPTNSIMSSRPGMIKLAQEVFGRQQASVVRAFGQFSTQMDLGRLIDAKRAGTFDYGAAIYDSPSGVKYPINITAILEVFGKSEAGVTVTAEDIATMYAQGPANDEILRKAAELLPKIVLQTGVRVQPTGEIVKNESDADAQVEAKKIVEFRAKPAEVELTEVPSSSNEGVDEVAELRQHLADALEVISKRFEAQFAFLRAQNERILQNQAIIDINLRKGFGGEIDFLNLDAPVPKVSPVPAAPKAVAPVVKAQEAALPPEAGESGPKTNGAGHAIDLTPESLKAMNIEQLRAVAVKVGVKDGHKIGFPKVARRKIHAALNWPELDE